MTGYEGGPSRPERGEGGEGIAERLAALVEAGLDPSIARVYQPGADELYRYPGMGPQLVERLAMARLRSVQEFQQSHTAAYERQFQDPLRSDVVSSIRSQLGRDGRSASDENVLRLMTHGPDIRQIIIPFVQGEKLGIQQSPVLRGIMQADVAHYFPEFEVDNRLLSEDSAFGDIAAYVFGGSPQRPVRLGEVSARLRELGVVDLSRAHADARRGGILGTAQFEAADMLLSNLRLLCILRPITGVRTANALAQRYKQALLRDDLDGKVALARELAAGLQHYGDHLDSRLMRQFADVMHRDAAQTASDLLVMRTFYDVIYDRLGYPLPSRRSAAAPDIGRAATGASVADTAVRQPDMETLRARAGGLAERWELTSRQRRARGFAGMQRALVTGEIPLPAAEVDLAAVPKARAGQLIDAVAHLHDLATSQLPERAQEALEEELVEQRTLADLARQASAAARAAKRPVEPIGVVPVPELVEQLRDQWRAYRELVSRAWPGGNGTAVADTVERLLFPETAAEHEGQ